MDDLEHGLHPLAQKKLVEIIKTLQGRFADLQILATSHSSHLLNYVEHEQVRLVAVGVEGGSVCGRLNEHPKFKKWKEEFYPGEMWSVFGEKWLVEPETANK